MKRKKPCPFECNSNDCKDCGAYTYSNPRMKNLSQSAQGYGLGIQKIKVWLKQQYHNEKE